MRLVYKCACQTPTCVDLRERFQVMRFGKETEERGGRTESKGRSWCLWVLCGSLGSWTFHPNLSCKVLQWHPGPSSNVMNKRTMSVAKARQMHGVGEGIISFLHLDFIRASNAKNLLFRLGVCPDGRRGCRILHETRSIDFCTGLCW